MPALSRVCSPASGLAAAVLQSAQLTSALVTAANSRYCLAWACCGFYQLTENANGCMLQASREMCGKNTVMPEKKNKNAACSRKMMGEDPDDSIA